jgi:hypothetical protein
MTQPGYALYIHYVVDVPCKLVSSPLLFAVLAGEIKLLDGMMVEGCIIFIDQSLTSVDSRSHCHARLKD